MTIGDHPSVGAEDLQDLQGVSKSPAVAPLQKQTVPPAPRPKDDSVPLAPTPLADISQPAEAESEKQAIFRALGQFTPRVYVTWFYEYLKFRIGPRHPFLTYEGKQPSDGIYPLEGDGHEIRVAVAGDWATGTDEAHRIAGLISEVRPHYTIHLGDVYFVGDTSEVRSNFLGLPLSGLSYTPCRWPLGSKGSFALNGNHEMYARGIAYFGEILPALGPVVDGKAQGQLASFFCLRNDAWCVLGLDTGYNSVGLPLIENVWPSGASLPDKVVKWLEAIAPQVENRAVIILTHHQVLSAYDDCFTKQADQIFAILNQPVLWLWGHEHRLVLYEPFADKSRGWPLMIGRCVGHGGMPVDLPGVHKPGSIGNASFVDKRPYHNDEKLQIGINGFAQLTFKGDALRIEYIDVFGQKVFREHLRAEGGSTVMQAFENIALSSP